MRPRVVAAALLTVAMLAPGTATAAIAGTAGTASAAEPCDPVDTTIAGATGADAWQAVTPARWRHRDGEVVLTEPGQRRAGPTRPNEHVVLTDGPRFGALHLAADVRIDTPTSVSDRDVVLLLGYRSDTRYAYVHLSQDATSSNHNGIFLVAGDDRVRIDDQGPGGAPPAITDTAWHRVEVTHCPSTGRLEVTVDGAAAPLLTATDRRIGAGRIGFGSFDNVGRMRDLVVRGAAAATEPCPAEVTDRFADDTGSPHATAIDCAAHHGIVRGRPDGRYGPSDPLTRGQLATIAGGTIEAAGGVLPGETDRFADVAGSPHALPIERLAAADVVAGYGGDRFGPGDRVTRAQAASIIDRAVTRLLGAPLPPGGDRFDDVDGVHAAAIGRLARAGIVEGTGPRRFDPTGTVTRGQAASLAVRAWTHVEARRD